MKAQASVEYLFILGIVLVVALLLGAIMSQFAPAGSESAEQQSRAYWRSTSPFSIQGIKVSGNAVSMEIKNEMTQRLNLTSIAFDGVDIGAAQFFTPGQTLTVTGIVPGFACSAGQPYEFRNVTITYSQGPVSGLTQTGEKPLYGKCS